MKKGLFVIAAITFMLTVVPSGEAGWKVYFKNSCTEGYSSGYSKIGYAPYDAGSIDFAVDGSHLFWNDTDCKITVRAGQEGVCELPGLICPVSCGGFMTYLNYAKILKQEVLNRASFAQGHPACWNISVEAMYVDGRCTIVKK